MHPRNAGIITHGAHDSLVELGRGTWEPILDELTLRAVRARLSDPSRRFGGPRRRDTALLTGLLWCDVCQGRVGAAVQRQQGHTYRYYSCRKGRHVNWPREWLDRYVTDVTKSVLSRPEWSGGWTDRSESLADAQAEAQRLTALLNDLLDERVEGRLTTEQYNRVSGKARARLEELEAQLGAGVDDDAVMHDAQDRAQRWDQLGTDERREVIRVVFPKILLSKPGSGPGKLPDPAAVKLQ